MRKIVLTALAAAALVAGPLATFASAGPPIPKVPTNGCELAEAIGVTWVRECEPPDSAR